MATKWKTHMNKSHEGKKDYKCEYCGKSYFHGKDLKRHIHKHHKNRNRPIEKGHKDIQCESCSKYFSQASHLKKHIHTVHDGHKDYKCESSL